MTLFIRFIFSFKHLATLLTVCLVCWIFTVYDFPEKMFNIWVGSYLGILLAIATKESRVHSFTYVRGLCLMFLITDGIYGISYLLS